MIQLLEEVDLKVGETSITLNEVFAGVRDGSIGEAFWHGRAATAFKCGTSGMNRTVIEKTWP